MFNVLEHSSNPLGSVSISCGFGLDAQKRSYPTLFYFSVPQYNSVQTLVTAIMIIFVEHLYSLNCVLDDRDVLTLRSGRTHNVRSVLSANFE